MKSPLNATFIVVLVWLSATRIDAQTKPPPRPLTGPCSAGGAGCEGSFSVYVDEDFLQTTPSTDRNYTMGLGFARATPRIADQHHDAPLKWAERLVSRIIRVPSLATSLSDANGRLFSEMLAGTAFTPEDLHADQPVQGDRPYAFVLGWTVTRMSPSDDSLSAYTSELTIGTIGSRLGRNVQRFIHHYARGGTADCDPSRRRETGPCDPKGWAGQVMDMPSLFVGTPTIRYALSREAGRDVKWWPDGSSMLEGVVGVGGEAGYYTSAWSSARIRFGYFQSPFYAWQQNPLGGQSRIPGLSQPELPWGELFLFGGLRPRALVYNALLQGYPGYTGYAFAFDQVRHDVVDGEVGVSGMLRFGHMRARSVRLTWVANGFRSPEFRGPRARWHQWGGAYLTAPSAWLPTLPNLLGM